MYLLIHLETGGTVTTEELNDRDLEQADDEQLVIVDLGTGKRYIGPDEWAKIEGKY